jgi:hypothetical protein
VATRVVWHGDVPLLLMIGLAAAGCGLYSAVLGARGTLFGRRKHEWLINRFMGERIRQFHFQSLVGQLALILNMAAESQSHSAAQSEMVAGARATNPAIAGQARAEFFKDRQTRFAAFRAAFDQLAREAKFGVTIGPNGEAAWSLCDQDDTGLKEGSNAALPAFFAAYRALRIQHQLDYANYKLTSDSRLFSDMPRRQAELLASVSKFGIQFVVVVHVCVVLIIVLSLIGHLLG